MIYTYTIHRIQIWSRWAYTRTRIEIRLRSRLTRLWIGSKFVRLGLWISPDLRCALGLRDDKPR